MGNEWGSVSGRIRVGKREWRTVSEGVRERRGSVSWDENVRV